MDLVGAVMAPVLQPALGQVGEDLWVAFAGDDASIIVRPRLVSVFDATAPNWTTASSSVSSTR